MTIAQMAEKAGVSKTAFEKYLAGPSSPRGTAIAVLCKEFDLSADWLLFGKSDTVAADDLMLLMLFHSDTMWDLVRDLREDDELGELFVAGDPSDVDWPTYFSDLVRKRSVEFLKRFRAQRRTRFFVGPSVSLFGARKPSSKSLSRPGTGN